jgi:ribosomal protein L11 methylase PrmA
VFANILARPLISLAQDIKRALVPGGTVILSGLLRTQERMVKAAYLSRGFKVVQPHPSRRLGDAGPAASLKAKRNRQAWGHVP